MMYEWYRRRSDKQKIAEHFRATPSPAELPMSTSNLSMYRAQLRCAEWHLQVQSSGATLHAEACLI
jgi:hypothetical protein